MKKAQESLVNLFAITFNWSQPLLIAPEMCECFLAICDLYVVSDSEFDAKFIRFICLPSS